MKKANNPLIGEFFFLLSLKERGNTDIYHSVKGRNGLANNEIEELITSISENFANETQLFPIDNISFIIPESSSSFIVKVADNLSLNYSILKKKDKNDIWDELIANFSLQKKEIERFEYSFSEMGDLFQLNKIKANQRWRFKDIIFDYDSIAKNSTYSILDDSVFTGHTISFIMSNFKIDNTFVIFSKW